MESKARRTGYTLSLSNATPESTGIGTTFPGLCLGDRASQGPGLTGMAAPGCTWNAIWQMWVLSLPGKRLVQRGGWHEGSVLVASRGIGIQVSDLAGAHLYSQTQGHSALQGKLVQLKALTRLPFSWGALMAPRKQQAQTLIAVVSGEMVSPPTSSTR